jgi:hypothetical protein
VLECDGIGTALSVGGACGGLGEEDTVPMSSPPLADRYFYECPCGGEWTYHAANNFLEPGHRRIGPKGNKEKQ